ncbi:MAG TPA: hypothetical protein ENG09_07340 [Candidatus Syntrophoarchaeum butanivorans]|uniref:Methanogenesis marker 9 domain-containing protein n=1 Tax=Candidatus Syntropharchaeum butanivorans TaxID=1839936 RepID=A0A7C0X2Z8_9EURY|nr:MAG: hypothetical protein CW694_04795 [Candidatus Syntrophoarchaeum sp. WYZ-LMO15]HDM37034.1 hypothetical protein [Candidatus Syntrophoarchaeum butanivorans]
MSEEKLPFDPRMVRDVPGWKNAAVPPCFGGDPRGLTFCCDPRYPLTFADKCRRKELLEKIGLTDEELIEIKLEFSRENGWDTDWVCFKSLAFCCMRKNGCYNRDQAIAKICGSLEDYFSKKRELAIKILKSARNRAYCDKFIQYEEGRGID